MSFSVVRVPSMMLCGPRVCSGMTPTPRSRRRDSRAATAAPLRHAWRRPPWLVPGGLLLILVLLTVDVLADGPLAGLDRRYELEAEGTQDWGRAAVSGTWPRPLPRSQDKALDALERDEVVGEALGPILMRGILRARREEWRRYHSQVTAWEQSAFLDRY